jgi:hypothetical protein
MRHLFKHLGRMGFLLCFLAALAEAGPAIPVQETVLGITESTRAKMLAYLARGDIAGAMTLYEAHTGRQAPAWLSNLQLAYRATNQLPGKCQDVARTIHHAFSQLGKSPEYVAFRLQGSSDYMLFELASGKHAPVSRTGYHVAVKLGEIIHDAYTGPLGMKLSDYVLRLQARSEISWMTVPQP